MAGFFYTYEVMEELQDARRAPTKALAPTPEGQIEKDLPPPSADTPRSEEEIRNH